MIFYETAGQGRLFVLLLCAGFFSGLLYDLLSLLRRRIPRAAWVIPDFLWALLTAGACGAALILGGEGTARLYALLGLLGGGGLYCLGLRAVIRSLRDAFQKRRVRNQEQKAPAVPQPDDLAGHRNRSA